MVEVCEIRHVLGNVCIALGIQVEHVIGKRSAAAQVGKIGLGGVDVAVAIEEHLAAHA